MPPPAGVPYNTFPLATEISDDEQAHTRSLIGIAVAIGGNVLISLALNCQKLAHKRLELERQKQRELHTKRRSDDPGENSDRLSFTEAEEPILGETRPLVEDRRYSCGSYTTPLDAHPRPNLNFSKDATSPRRHSALAGSPIMMDPQSEDTNAISIHITGGNRQPSSVVKHANPDIMDDEEIEMEHNNETDYLRSKLWWFGFFLMNVGEFGNFLSYAYAPASVVAPLGTVALIANCFFAPLMLKEKLRRRDFLGVVLAIFGAVTIVGAAKPSDVRLDPAALIRAITRRPFVIYVIVCAVLITIFGILSAASAGRKWVWVDVGLCALFGGFTVLATKAISTLLSLRWIEIFKDWITYPIVAILVSTGIGQIKYLNRALMKFDAKVVIPTFFVSFNLSAIVGSAILYGDFENVEVHQFTTFLYGCATTFLGVFFLTRSTEEAGATLEEAVVQPESIEESEDDGQPNVGRVTRPPLLPTQPRGLPVLRANKSTTSLVLSPGQYLLLATSPPRDRAGSTPDRPGSMRHSNSNVGSPASASRRRAGR